MVEELDTLYRRFWYCTYRQDEGQLYHSNPECSWVKENISEDRNLFELPETHIPLDAGVIGSDPHLNFCSRCVSEAPWLPEESRT